MFFKKSSSIDIALAMEDVMVASATADANKIDTKRAEAVEYLKTAISAFREAGMNKYANATIVLANISEGNCKKPSNIEKNVWSHFANIHYAEDGSSEEEEEEEESYNQPDYQFYVVVKTKSGIEIESGWEYKEDAMDQIENLPIEYDASKVLTAMTLANKGIDVNDDSNWISGDIDFEVGETDFGERYSPTHEGPGEAKRESLEDQFINSILGDENNAENYDALFEDV